MKQAVRSEVQRLAEGQMVRPAKSKAAARAEARRFQRVGLRESAPAPAAPSKPLSEARKLVLDLSFRQPEMDAVWAACDALRELHHCAHCIKHMLEEIQYSGTDYAAAADTIHTGPLHELLHMVKRAGYALDRYFGRPGFKAIPLGMPMMDALGGGGNAGMGLATISGCAAKVVRLTKPALAVLKDDTAEDQFGRAVDIPTALTALQDLLDGVTGKCTELVNQTSALAEKIVAEQPRFMY